MPNNLLLRVEKWSEAISKPTAIIGVAFLLLASGLTIATPRGYVKFSRCASRRWPIV